MKLPLAIKKLLHEIAQNKGFSNYKFELDSGSDRGDNYVGVLTSVKLTGDRLENGVVITETLHLICKLAPESKRRREVLYAIPPFEREIQMYTRVLPAFVAFQQEKGLTSDESFLSFPKVYACTAGDENDTYALIMEDLRPKNFVMWSRHDSITMSHETLVFKQLGRFHGISFALKDQRPEVFAEFKNLNDILTTAIEAGNISKRKIIDETMQRALNVLKSEEHKNVIKRLRNNYFDTLKSLYTTEALEKFGVVCHGDCWTNNLLFQHDGNVIENCF